MPLPPERSFPLVVALFLAVLAGALVAAGLREAGALGALGAAAALAFGVRLEPALAFGHPDGVVAALVVVAAALRGWPRVAALVLAGLLRPEAWLLAGLAAAWEARGPVRRAAYGVGALLLPALLWLLLDLALAGDALATRNWRSGRDAVDYGTLGPVELVRRVWTQLTEVAHPVVVVLGLAGLGLHAWLARRRDPFPFVAAAVWVAVLAVERESGIELNPRYFLPAAALLALGCGLLPGLLLPEGGRDRHARLAAAAGAALLVLGTVFMDLGRDARSAAARTEAAEAAWPALAGPLACGDLATTGPREASALIPQLAAGGREPLRRFALYEPGGTYGGVLRFDAFRFETGPEARALRRASEGAQLPPWPRTETALGPLALAPGCA